MHSLSRRPRLRRFLPALFLLLLCAPIHAQKQYWEQQRVVTSPLFQFFEIQCADSLHCVACGERSRDYVFRTVDGGISWSVVWSVAGLDLYDIAHPTPRLIVVVADTLRNGRAAGVIARSSDAGATWSYRYLATDATGAGMEITGIDMSDSLHGIIAQRISNRILRTVDGGLTWEEIPLPDTSVRYTSNISSPDPSTYIVHAWSPALGRFLIHRTTDAGATWESSSQPLPPLARMRFVNRRLGFGAGEGEGRIDIISRTIDGGLTWERMVDEPIVPVQGLTDIACLDSVDCIAVGNAGKILRTHDGWVTWTREESGFGANWYPASMNAVAYPARETAIAAALNGYLLRYRPEGFVSQPTILLPLSPSDEQISTSPRIVWTSVAGATAYQVQLSYADIFDSLQLERTVVGDTSMVAAGLAKFKEYHLRVRAIGATGPGNWSNPPHVFRTGGASAVPPRANDGACIVAVVPNPFTGTTRIRLRVAPGATLGVYTLLGEQVSELTSRIAGCAGKECSFDLGTDLLPVGTYLLRYRDADHAVVVMVTSRGD